MAVAPVFEYDLPLAFEPYFTDGERALGFATPIGNVVGRKVFYLSKWFDFEGGYYTLKFGAREAATIYESVSRGNSKTLGSFTVSDNPMSLTVYISRGRRRLDIVLSKTSTNTAAAYTAFSLWQNNKIVYTSSADGWVFDQSPVADADVPALIDEALTYPVFALLPDWSSGITERIEWNTEVLPSETDTEQRRAVRRYPRRSFEVTYTDWDVRRDRLNNFLSGALNRKILVPLWFEQIRLKEPLGTAIVMPEGALGTYEFAAGDYVLAIDKDPSFYDILEVDSVNLVTDTITFTGPATNAWGKGARIVPLRVARVVDTPAMDNLTDRAGNTRLRFEIEGAFKYPAGGWGSCAPVFDFKINRADNLSVNFEQRVFTIDNGTGLIDITDPGQRTRMITRASMIHLGRSKVFAFRQFLSQAAGRLDRFWFPSQTYDAHPIGDFGGDYFDVRKSGLADYMRTLQETRVMLAIAFKDRRPTVYRRVVDITALPNAERIFLERPLGQILLRDVERLMFVHPARFEQDAFELQHVVDGSHVVRATVVVRSTNADGMPDIECSITSQPYPVYNQEEVNFSASLVGGDLRIFGYQAEAVDLSVTIQSGNLRDLLKAYGIQPEAVDLGQIALLSGEFRELLRSLTAPTELLDLSNPVLLSGVLKEALINYTNWTSESVDLSVSLIGGSLS